MIRPGAEARLVDALRFGRVDERRAAARRLCDLAGRGSVRPLRDALRDPDGEVRALARRALARIEDRLSREIAVARDKVRRAPEDPASHVALAGHYAEYCYLGLLDESTSRHYLELAVKGYARALEPGRGEPAERAPEVLSAIGKALLALGRTRIAATFLDRAAALAPGDPRVKLWQAEAAFFEGDLARTRAACKEALALRPADERVRAVAEYWAGAGSAESGAGSAESGAGTAARTHPREGSQGAPPETPLSAAPSDAGGGARAAPSIDDEARALVGALASFDPAVRAAAAERLEARTSEEAIAALARAGEHAPPGAALLCARHLGRLAARGLSGALEALVPFLDAEHEAIRREASLGIEAAPETPERTRALVRALKCRGAFGRVFAATALGRAGAGGPREGSRERNRREARACVAALLDALRDPVTAVRETALAALGDLEIPSAGLRAIGDLAIEDGVSEVRRAALLALGRAAARAGRRSCRAALRVAAQAASDLHPRVREAAHWALGRLGGPAAAFRLARAVREDEDEAVRAEAARQLADVIDRRRARAAEALLFAHAFDRSRVVRQAAAFAIDDLPAGVRARVLFSALEGQDAGLRAAAAARLGQAPLPHAFAPLFARLAGDPEPEVRAAAATALGRIDPVAARAALESAVGDPSDAVAAAAAGALYAIDAAGALAAVAARLRARGPGDGGGAAFVRALGVERPDRARLPPLSAELREIALASLSAAAPGDRRAAAALLGAAGGPEAAPRLFDLVARDPRPEVAQAAARAALRIFGDDPAPVLARLAAPDLGPAEAAALLEAMEPGAIAPERRDEIARRLVAAAPSIAALGARAEARLFDFFRADPRLLLDLVGRRLQAPIETEALRLLGALFPCNGAAPLPPLARLAGLATAPGPLARPAALAFGRLFEEAARA